MKGTLIFTVTFCFISLKALAYTAINGLPYSYHNQNFHWTSKVENSLVRLQLVSNSDELPTQIEFSWDQNVRSRNQFFDESQNVISAKPNRILWTPHPTQAKTLEETFITALYSIDYPKLNIPYLIQDEQGQVLVSGIEDFLKVYRTFKPTLTPDGFLLKVKNQISEASNHLIHLDTFKNASIIPSFLNIVEPIKSGNRYDAFNLFPLLAYKQNKSEFRDALKNWANTDSLNILKKYRDTSIPLNIRHSLLALLTHNHLVEINLIKLVALEEGVDTAWDVAKDINQLYLSEQHFWTKGISRHDIVRRKNSNLLNLLENSHFKPYDNFIQIEASPVFLMEECASSNPDVLSDLASMIIPAARSYHFYGSIVTAQKMKNLKLPKEIALMINNFLINQYQTNTHATQVSTNNYIKNLYFQGTQYVYMCN